MTTPPVEIVTLQSLLDRPGFVGFQNTLPTGRVFACLGTAESPCGLVPIDFDSGLLEWCPGQDFRLTQAQNLDGRILTNSATRDPRTDSSLAQLGPLLERSPLSIAERQSLWHAAIHWATRQRAVALQIVCSSEDLDPLAQLGWDGTTEILQLVHRPGAVESHTPDSAIFASAELRGPEAIELVGRTLIDSLDLPEALPIRTPLALIESWHESIPLMKRLILTARGPDGPVGILVAGPGSEGVEIRYLGVDHRYRQQGWGRRLLQAAVQRNAGVPITAFVDARNFPAVQLYQQLGFVEEHRSPLCFRILQP